MVSKTSRQLVVFHFFMHYKMVTYNTVNDVIKVSHKTVIRDIRDLNDAGLIDVIYSKKQKCYIHNDDKIRCPFLEPIFSSNNARNKHLEKIIRLAKIMVGLKSHTELPYWHDDYTKEQLTCLNWYKTHFPHISTRTMYRDFEELNKVGYFISYDFYEKRYIVDFPIFPDGICLK